MIEPLAVIWEDYRTTVIPPDASPVQVRETERAFYAGAFALLTAFHRTTSAEETVHAMEAWMAECLAMAKAPR